MSNFNFELAHKVFTWCLFPLGLFGCGGGGSNAVIPPLPEIFSPPATEAKLATAIDDNAVTYANNSVVINLLANDLDLGEGVHQIEIERRPFQGEVEMVSSTRVRYIPDPQATGSDSFQYSLSNAAGNSQAAAVTIEILNPDQVIPFRTLQQTYQNSSSIEAPEAYRPIDLAIHHIGDFNQDGFDDLFITSGLSDENLPKPVKSAAYLMYGHPTFNLDEIDLNSILPAEGFSIFYDGIIGQVAGEGDINGDGIHDLVFSESALNLNLGNGPHNNETYVLYGGQDFGQVFDVNDLDGNNGFVINTSGKIAFLGDVNGDQVDDIGIGHSLSGGGGLFSGQVDIIYGSNAFATARMDIGPGSDRVGYRLYGRSGDRLGSSIRPLGDTNGDGLDDFAVGSSALAANSFALVVYGTAAQANQDLYLNELSSSQGFRIHDPQSGFFTTELLRLGDVNGDILDDYAYAKRGDDATLSDSRLHVLFGPLSPQAGRLDLSAEDVDQLTVGGFPFNQQSNLTVEMGHDHFGTGLPTLAIGLPNANIHGLTEAGLISFFDLSDLTTPTTYAFDQLARAHGAIYAGGETEMHLGSGVNSQSDLNGDSLVDLVISAKQLYLLSN